MCTARRRQRLVSIYACCLAIASVKEGMSDCRRSGMPWLSRPSATIARQKGLEVGSKAPVLVLSCSAARDGQAGKMLRRADLCCITFRQQATLCAVGNNIELGAPEMLQWSMEAAVMHNTLQTTAVRCCKPQIVLQAPSCHLASAVRRHLPQ